jgi:hypothetical protein
MLRQCGNVSPSGLEESCVTFPVAHATGRDVPAAGLNRTGQSWFLSTQAGDQHMTCRWRQPPMMPQRPEADTGTAGGVSHRTQSPTSPKPGGRHIACASLRVL